MQNIINDDSSDYSNSQANPTIAGVVKRLAQYNGELLNEKQYIPCEIVCCTFLLQLLNEGLDPTSCVSRQTGLTISAEDNSEMIEDIKE